MKGTFPSAHRRSYRPDHACRGCSFLADQVAHLAHLNARDTTLGFASRAPQADIERLKKRMDWKMPWFTITDSFDADFGVNEWHGTNAFIRDDDRVFRTYFVNNRGDEQMAGTISTSPRSGARRSGRTRRRVIRRRRPNKWWNWHDAYGDTGPCEWSSVVDRGLTLQDQTVERPGSKK